MVGTSWPRAIGLRTFYIVACLKILRVRPLGSPKGLCSFTWLPRKSKIAEAMSGKRGWNESWNMKASYHFTLMAFPHFHPLRLVYIRPIWCLQLPHEGKSKCSQQVLCFVVYLLFFAGFKKRAIPILALEAFRQNCERYSARSMMSLTVLLNFLNKYASSA